MIDLSHLLWPGAGLGLISSLQQGWFAFTLLLWLAAILYSVSSQREDLHKQRYWLFMLLSFSGNLLLIAAQDALSFYLGFSLMSLAATGLVLHTRSKAAKRAARLYLQLAILGELLLFSALVLRASAAGGVYDWQSWQSVPLDHLTLTLFLLGLGLKAGFFPLHLWLPQAHPVAPAAASAVLSGAMIKAGIFGLWFFLPAGDAILALWAPWLMLLGLVSAYFGALSALCHTAPKTILAYSSVSQIGYLLLLLSYSWLTPDSEKPLVLMGLLAYAAHHAFAKGALFLLAGSGAKYRFTWWDKLITLLLALSMMALPLSSGAAVKSALKTLSGAHNLPGNLLDISVLLTLGGGLTALALWHFIYRLWLQQQGLSQQGQQHRVQPPLPWLQRVPVAVLALALVLLPWAWPALREFALQALTGFNSVVFLLPILLALAFYHLLAPYVLPVLQRWGKLNRWVFAVSLSFKRAYQPIKQPAWPALNINWRLLDRKLRRLLR